MPNLSQAFGQALYDSAAAEVVLFGGELASKKSGDPADDAWLFDREEENWSRLAAMTLDQV